MGGADGSAQQTLRAAQRDLGVVKGLPREQTNGTRYAPPRHTFERR